MNEFKYLFKIVVIEKKQILLASLLGFIAAISSIGLMSTGGYLISQSALHPPLHTLTLIIVAVRFFGLARAGARYLERYVSHKVTFTILGRLRVFFYDKIEPLAPSIFMNYRSGDLLARIVADVESLQYFFLRVIYPPIVMLFVFFATGLILSVFSWKFAIILFIGLLLAGLLLPIVIYSITRRVGNTLRQKRAQFTEKTAEFMYGHLELKMNNQLTNSVDNLNSISNALIVEQERNNIIAAIGENIALVIGFLITWLVLVTGVILVETSQIGGVFLALLVLAALTVFEAVIPVASMTPHIEESSIAAKRLFENIDNKKIIIQDNQMEKIITLNDYSIEFENVTFSYPNVERKVLKDVNFSIKHGQKIAIIGHSGSGKSSIINLLLKFYTTYDGNIYIGSNEIRHCDDDNIRTLFAVVEQNNHFFNTSVRKNLLLANREATDEQMENMLQKVSLDYIKLDQIINEKGLSLSGGERQRLAIARMLLKDAPILLLDEISTGIDLLTEQTILSSIWPEIKHKTVVYITHRLNNLDKMDKIIVIDKGQIMEQGNYKELLAKKGYLYKLKQLETKRIV